LLEPLFGVSHKYHLANWGLIYQKQEFGGMGVPNLREFNLCLLGSWIKRYHLDNNKIWKSIIEAKYDLGPNIFWANPSTCSPFWKGIMWPAQAVKMGYRRKVGRGDRVLFWEDTWIGNCCLAVLYWDLYIIANEHHCTIASVWDGMNLMLTYRRTVSIELYERWTDLVSLISFVNLSNVDDQPIWIFRPSGSYSVKSFYGVISNGGVVPIHSSTVWVLWIPPGFMSFFGLC
jgi:hypothetical protein